MTTNPEQALAQFKQAVEGHSMEVLLDSGTHRHLRFSRNGSAIHRFNIVTWPGYLAISGDMGDYMFSRLPDMFDFFRSKKGLYINPGYWDGKLQAGANGGKKLAKEWSADAFRENVMREFEMWAEEREDLELAEQVLTDLRRDVLDHADFEQEAYQALNDWDDVHVNLSDFWEYDCTDFTHHYLICCYAIVWAIQQYDAAKQEGA